ncbi:hypothetical protein OH76DRAFT_1328342, partial [Lentinus brumalis]
LVCFNLPPHLQYLPENIFLVGVIPGPKEPNVHQLNHILRPLVDELLEMWDPGIFLSTPLYPTGRRVRAALIPIIADLPALRKTTGFASHSADLFCNFCLLHKADENIVDCSKWPPRPSWKDHIKLAEEWLALPTLNARKDFTKATGVRWTELLRLPYWDPTRYTLVDSMHNLFLG